MTRKRVRGLRRHWRNHQKWATVPKPLDLSFIAKYHYDYSQLGLAPWTVHGRPPVAFRRLWATRLLAELRQWQAQLTPLHPGLYLAVYLYDVRFGKSQVVAAIQERKLYYKQRFDEAQSVPLPAEYQTLPGAAELTWTAHEEVDVFHPEEFAELGKWGARHRHWLSTTRDGDDCVVMQTGYVWVGRAAT